MSYFFGTPVSVVDNRAIKNSQKTKMVDKNLTDDDDHGKPTDESKHRRKRSSKLGSVAEAKTGCGDGNRRRVKVLSPSRDRRRHRNRDVDDIADARNAKLENLTDDAAGIMEKIIENNQVLSRAKSKYGKLENIYDETKSERDKLSLLLEKRDFEYRQLQDRCQELTQFVSTTEEEKIDALATSKKLIAHNAQLREDVGLLKIIIYRLNVELERYQDKLRMIKREEECDNAGSGNDDVDPTLENKMINEAWSRVNLHALGPLLEAYQENLSEKDRLVRQYGCEMNNFSGRCKDVVAENEFLRTELENVKSQYESSKDETNTIIQDAAIVKEQNDLLQKQISLQKLKLQQIHTLYENKLESLSRENNKLHDDYSASNTELSNLRGKYEIMSEGYEKLKTNTEKTMPVSVYTTSIDECKRLFEELKCQYDGENKKLTDQLKRLEQSCPENERQLAVVKAERDHLEKQTKNLEKNLKRTQYKLDRVQKNVVSMEISKESLKRQLHKTTAYCEELVAEHERLLSEREKLMNLVKDREKENENIQYLGSNIAHRMGNLKSQLHSVQKGAKEQLKSVEKHIKIQELGVGRMKTDYNRELQRLKQLVKQKEDVIGKLQREKYATQDNLELVWRAATSDDKKVKDALKNTKICNV